MTEKEKTIRLVIDKALHLNQLGSDEEIEEIVNRAVPLTARPDTIKKINQNRHNIWKTIGWGILLWVTIIPCEVLFYMIIFSSSLFFKQKEIFNIVLIIAIVMGCIIALALCSILAIKIYDILQIYTASCCKLILILCVIYWTKILIPGAEEWLQYLL